MLRALFAYASQPNTQTKIHRIFSLCEWWGKCKNRLTIHNGIMMFYHITRLNEHSRILVVCKGVLIEQATTVRLHIYTNCWFRRIPIRFGMGFSRFFHCKLSHHKMLQITCYLVVWNLNVAQRRKKNGFSTIKLHAESIPHGIHTFWR